ncbi:hypothetical protein SDC9_194835 [bioreactor metagenome]|uniref:Uncharacterized protein n=1 Tax=bioreactor metagenome TaxID=1076179 RepID=A0A645IG14_9ZZZZ
MDHDGHVPGDHDGPFHRAGDRAGRWGRDDHGRDHADHRAARDACGAVHLGTAGHNRRGNGGDASDRAVSQTSDGQDMEDPDARFCTGHRVRADGGRATCGGDAFWQRRAHGKFGYRYAGTEYVHPRRGPQIRL